MLSKGKALTKRLASNERVASVSTRATTDGIVVYNFTPSSNSARSRARIYTFLINARLVKRALGTNYAFWSASRWSAYETRHARAHRLAVHFTALAVRAAR